MTLFKRAPRKNEVALRDRRYMALALEEAARAAARGEVPIGAVLVLGDRIVGKGYNLTRTNTDPTAHAEIVALQAGAKVIKNERFLGCELYVTLEPCAMCAGAIVQARLARLIYGARDPKAGACGSALKVVPNKKLNHRPAVVKLMMADESAALLKGFFLARRGRATNGL